MCRNFSFCIAFLLLVHMSSAILTGASNSEEFKISKVASSSLESIDDKADKTAIRTKRGFDYSDYSPESSEENIAYFHRPQYIAYPSHWPHHSQHRLPPTPHTGGYGIWQSGPTRPPYYHGKYHFYFHDKKCKFPFYYNSGEYEDSNSDEQTESIEIMTSKNLPNDIDDIPSSTSNPITPSTTSTEIISTTTSSTTTDTTTVTTTPTTPTTTTTEYVPKIDIRLRD